MDEFGIVAVAHRLHRAEGAAARHVGEADDGIERRAQFVAHMCQELRLGAVGAFGGMMGLPQFARLGFQLAAIVFQLRLIFAWIP